MQTVNHHIRTTAVTVLREIRVEPKMRSVSLIHDQRNLIRMNDFRNGSDIRNHTVISGRHQHHRLNFRICLQCSLYLSRFYYTIDLPGCIKFRIKIHRFQSSELHGVIYRFVAVSCHQKFSASVHTPQNGAHDSRRTSVDQDPGSIRPIKLCDTLLQLQQDSVCMMQIIKSIDLCNINSIGQSLSHQLRIPLMSRHMKPIEI